MYNICTKTYRRQSDNVQTVMAVVYKNKHIIKYAILTFHKHLLRNCTFARCNLKPKINIISFVKYCMDDAERERQRRRDKATLWTGKRSLMCRHNNTYYTKSAHEYSVDTVENKSLKVIAPYAYIVIYVGT